MKKKSILLSVSALLVFLALAFLVAYRFVGVGGRVILVDADHSKGFDVEYYLFLPDTLHTSDASFLLVEPNNTGFVDDNHQSHRGAAHNIIRFGQANRIARGLGVPLLVPCFDRTQTDWERYTHALDRDTLLCDEGTSARIDLQLLAMVGDAHDVLAQREIRLQDKVLLNGFSASGSFVNRFTALHPEQVAATAAGGLNSMVILPADSIDGSELLYPVGIADLGEIAGLEFASETFAAVPQYYYMGEYDDNDSLHYPDAYSDVEREIIITVLGKDMGERWENCRRIYEQRGVDAAFRVYPGIGHEAAAEIDGDIISFFTQAMAAYS